jgi:DNA-binding GntR family transcriptional regulator
VEQQQPRKRGRPRRMEIAKAVGEGLRLSRANLHERAVERLRKLIISGELAQGTDLVEAELCALLGLSRTPLREAFKVLAADGLIELRQNRSARVTTMNSEEIVNLFEALSGIERHGAELAAARMCTAEIEQLRIMQQEMESYFIGDDIGRYFKLNQALHQAIVGGAHNPLLSETHDRLIARAERARYSALGSRWRWDQSVQEHRGILAALETRNAEAAGRLLADHVISTGREVVQALAAQEPARAKTAAA